MSKGRSTRATATSTALDLASVSGLDGLSIARVATRAGLSKSGLFAHYGSKEALQVAVLDEAWRTFATRIVAPIEAEPAGLVRLRAFFERWLGWTVRVGLSGGCPFAAAAFELDDVPGPVRDRVETAHRAGDELLRSLVADAVETGELDSGTDVAQVTWEITGAYLAHHVSLRFLEDDDADRRALAALDHIIDRVRPPR